MAQVCSVCGDVRNEVPLEALGHDLRDITRQEPTCTEPGCETGVCSRCGETIQTTFEALGHDFVETARQEPTCTEPGSVTATCSRCGETIQTPLEALGHDFVETGRQEPTEEQEGWVDYTCSRCGESKRETLAPPDAGANAWVLRRKKRETKNS